MAYTQSINVHRVTGDDEVSMQSYGVGARGFFTLDLPGNVSLFFDGFDGESEDNLIGFLDQLHAIRNALLQDRADRTATPAC